MSNIAIKGATTGTGTFTIESPATNTDRTLTLPDEAGTILTTTGDGSGLTGISSYADSDALSLFNVTGSAPVYACRAWVNFDGTTNVGGNCTVRASGNVSSVTDNATGEYRINFSTAFPDNDYAVAPTQGDNQGRGIIRTDEYNTSNVKVFVRRYDQDAAADDGTVCAIIVR